MLTQPNVTALAALTQLLAVGGPYHGAKLALFSAGPQPGPGSVLADYTLAAFTGATPITPTFGSPYIDAADGLAYADAFASFTMTGGTNEAILGYVLTDTGGTNLIGGEVFATARNMTTGSNLAFVARIAQTRDTGGTAVVIP